MSSWRCLLVLLPAACASVPAPETVPPPVAAVASPARVPVPVAAPEPLPESPAVVAEKGVLIRFAVGSTQLDPAETDKVVQIAARLLEDRKAVVKLTGYANNNGSTSYNLAISDRRLAVVVRSLRQQGVEVAQIRRQAVGAEKTPANCRSAACRDKYRGVLAVMDSSR